MSSLPDQLAHEAGHEDVTAARVEQLYTSHAGLVRSVCRSLLRDSGEAEDALQQTFLSAQQALLNGSSPRHAAAWLATIARHESLARVRARMRAPLPVDTEAEGGGPDAYAVAVNRHEVGELCNALGELPAQQRDAILMREVRGLSYEEVASALSVTPAAVESLIFRARRSLQVRLREALAAFSPAITLRDLAARVGGGVAAPAAAKAVAAGVGAAVIAGSALVGPRAIGLGHASSTPPAAKVGATTRQTRASVSLDRRKQLIADSHATQPKTRDARTRGERDDGASTGSFGSSSDGRGDTSSTSDGSSGSTDGSRLNGGETQTTRSGSGDTSTTSDGGGSGSSDGSTGSGDTQTTSSGSGDTSTTSDGGGSGSSDGSTKGSGYSQPPGSLTDGRPI